MSGSRVADGVTEDAWEKLGPGQQPPSSIPGPVALVMGAMETREVCVWKEGGEAGRAPGSSVSTLGYRFPHLPDPGQGAERGRWQSLGSKAGKGNGGRKGREGGVWLSKVLNLEPKLGGRAGSSLRHTEHLPPFGSPPSDTDAPRFGGA